MRYQIDQSGKIEDTKKLTIVAFANGKVKSLKISAVEKRKLIQAMRELEQPRKIFVFKIFAALICLLFRDEKLNFNDCFIIDKEYPGHEGIIKDVLSGLFQKLDKAMPDIEFREIGKKSIAHIKAIEVFRGKTDPNIIIKTDDVLKLLYK